MDIVYLQISNFFMYGFPYLHSKDLKYFLIYIRVQSLWAENKNKNIATDLGESHTSDKNICWTLSWAKVKLSWANYFIIILPGLNQSWSRGEQAADRKPGTSDSRIFFADPAPAFLVADRILIYSKAHKNFIALSEYNIMQ